MKNLNPTEKIIGNRIFIEKLRIDKNIEQFELIDSARNSLSEFLPWVSHVLVLKDTIESTANFLEEWKKGTLFDFQIMLIGSEKLIGRIGVHTISIKNKRAEIGYWLHPDHEGKGFVSEALRLIEEEFFRIGFNRLEIRCDQKNLKSFNVPKRNGYILEGILRENEVDHKGRVRSTAIFSKLSSEA